MNRVLPLLLLALMVGCSRSEPMPRTLAGAKEFAAKARDEAKAAREAKSPKDAVKAAGRAQKASDLAKVFLKRPGATPADNALAAETFAAVRDAKRFADLAEEDVRLAGEVSSLKAKSYRATREAIIRIAFMSLAKSARSAKARAAETPPRPPSTAAQAAADVAEYCGRARLGDGSIDWAGVASDMDVMGASPPPVVRMILAFAFLVSAQNRLALYEIESAEATLIAKPEERSLFHLLRGVVHSMNGFPKLAAEQTELAAAAAGEDPKAVGPQWLGLVHFALACEYARQKEWAKADIEVVRSMQVWPDNPLAVFLTGERLAADGQYEKAAESLEIAAAGSKAQWLAKKLAARAREVRDRKGDAKPLFCDTRFLCDVMIFCVADKAEEKAPQQLRGVVDAARWLGEKLVENLPMTE